MTDDRPTGRWAAMSLADRLQDADRLWGEGRRESALLLILAAVGAVARREYPMHGDRAAFEGLLRDRWDWQIELEFRGECHRYEAIFYKWLRCELVHAGGLPADIEFLDDVPQDALVLRAGGAPGFKLGVSPAWFAAFRIIVRDAVWPERFE